MTDQACPRSTVVIISADASIRDSLRILLEAASFEVQAFGSAHEFARGHPLPVPSCLVLDVRTPDVNVLDLQIELATASILSPIVFITGYRDLPMSVRTMKPRDVEFLPEPVCPQDLLQSVRVGLERDRDRLEKDATASRLRTRFDMLTPRERQMFAFATSGLLNKQIANALGLSEITVRMRRGSLSRKMGARSAADLVRMADTLGIERIKP